MALVAVTPARASQAGSGTVSQILTIAETNSVLFIQTGTRTTVPTCGQANPSRWAIAAGTPFGQAQLAVLLTAYAQRKQVTIVGMNSCYRQSDTESVQYIVIND